MEASTFLILSVLAGTLPLHVRAGAQSNQIVSRPTRVSASAGGHSLTPGLSADGRSIVFVSQARNLLTNDNHGLWLNAYLQHLSTTNTELLSVTHSGAGGASEDATAPSVSSNGQFVVFQSAADDLVPGDTNKSSDVFVRDLVNQRTMLLSHSTDGDASGNGPSVAPLISADASRVVFESAASNLVAEDANGVTDVFAYSLVTGGTVLVSAEATAAGDAIGPSDTAAISGDGGRVVFVKHASNLVSSVPSRADIYVRDIAAGTTAWASAGVASSFLGIKDGYRCSNPTISADGRVVAFLATKGSTNFDVFFLTNAALLFRYEESAGPARLVAAHVLPTLDPVLSADGRYLAYAQDGALLLWDEQEGSNHLASACGPGGAPIVACRAPALAADGSRVAFIGSQGGPLAVYVYDLRTGCAQLASVNTNGMAAAVLPFSVPTLSGDGLLVGFESPAADLVARDYNQSTDIFLRDLAAGTTRLISQRAETLPSATGMRPATLLPKSVSADGRVVAFASVDTELVPEKSNPWQDVYAHDLASGRVERLNGSGASGLHYRFYPVVSANGRYVAYYEDYTNIVWVDRQAGVSKLIANALPGEPFAWFSDRLNLDLSPDGRYLAFTESGSPARILRRDMWAENATNEVVSVTQGPGSTSPGPGFRPMFSPDGQWIAFRRDLTGGELDARHLASGQLRVVSPRSASGRFADCVFSANARYLFYSAPSVGPLVTSRHDLLADGPNLVICTNCWKPSPSANGQLVALATGRRVPPDDVFVVDLQTGENKLVSVNQSGTGGGNRSSGSPLLSHDGRYVVFVSQASDLVANDANNASDVFVRDLWKQTTMLVSINRDGTGSGNALSTAPVLAGDGRTVLFQSFASDLVPGDFNRTGDIYSLRLSGPDSDGDGMDDDWEMAYFGTLARDGRGDFDQDGKTDLEEFRAGTNPIDDESVLRVLTLTRASESLGGPATTTLLWSATPGKSYRVEFKPSTEAAWQEVAGDVVATSTTATKAHPGAPASVNAFYRVRLLP